MKIHKQLSCATLFLSALLISEVKAEDVRYNGFPPNDKTPTLAPTSPEVERAVQFTQLTGTIQSISMEYDVSESEDGGMTWETTERHMFHWDKASKSMFHRTSKYSDGSIDKADDVIINGNEKMLKGIEFGKKKRETINIQRTRENFEDYSDFPSWILNYSFFVGDLSIIKNERYMKVSRLTLVKHEGKDALKFHHIPVLRPKTNSVEWEAYFDPKTGYLLQRSEFDRKADIKLKITRRLIEIATVNGYFHSNGVPFPTELIYKYGEPDLSELSIPDGVTYTRGKTICKYKINAEKTKINAPIDKKVFRTTLPPGASVMDDVRGKWYYTSAIGSTDAELQIAKDLEELFKKSDK